VRARLRLEGECRAEDRAEVYSTRYPLDRLSGPARGIHRRDVINNHGSAFRANCLIFRVSFPWIFGAGSASDRLREPGVYGRAILPEGFPINILAGTTNNRYGPGSTNPRWRVQNLSSGGCNGERCPGWYTSRQTEVALGVLGSQLLAGVSERTRPQTRRVEVWACGPERGHGSPAQQTAAAGETEKQELYRITNYWPVDCRIPYVAFIDPGKKMPGSRGRNGQNPGNRSERVGRRGDPAV